MVRAALRMEQVSGLVLALVSVLVSVLVWT
jgi:hypothetical protein